MVARDARILILCKTYPSPSAKHVETSCVAGVGSDGKLLRLFPVPFRLIKDEQQFKKWQWISARIRKANDDHRPESHKIFVDTIRCDQKQLPTKNNWGARRDVIKGVPVHSDFQQLEQSRLAGGATLGLLQPSRILGVDIVGVDDPEWSAEELKKLVQHQQQGGLFDDADAAEIRTLRKLPFSFYYRYECDVGGTPTTYRHKIVDWEIGALYWRCRREYREDWQEKFKQKLEQDLPARDLMFLMGTIHRFPDKWLIVSLLYPPRTAPTSQAALPF
jgi:hypothetical protein